MKSLFKHLVVIMLMINLLSAKNNVMKKPLFIDNCSNFAYSGLLEDMAINYLKYAKNIIKQNTSFIEVTKFDLILYKMAFSQCFVETINDLKNKIMNESSANILENATLPFDFTQGTSSNTPSNAVKTTSEPDLPFMQTMFKLFSNSADYVATHLLKCTFDKFHSYQRFIESHLNQYFKLKMNTFNYISKLCKYELVREDEEYNPIIVEERDKILSKIKDVNIKVNTIINSSHPIDTLKSILNNQNVLNKKTIDLNTTEEYSKISYVIKNDIFKAHDKLDKYLKSTFVKKQIKYENDYLFNILGEIKKIKINENIGNTFVKANLAKYSDLYVMFLSYLDNYYQNVMSLEMLRYVMPMFIQNYRFKNQVIFINMKNTSADNIILKPQPFNLVEINRRLLQMSLFDNKNKLLPNNIKKSLVYLAYISNRMYNQYDKNLYKKIKNDEALNKYGVYYATIIDINLKIVNFLKNELYKQIQGLIPLGIQIKKVTMQTAVDYEINKLIDMMNVLLKNLNGVKSGGDIFTIINNATELKLSVFNHTLKYRQNCNIYVATEAKRVCKLLKQNFFKDFDLFSGLQENTDSIVQGFTDELDEINSYTSDKQFNAKMDEVQVDIAQIDTNQ